MSNQTNESNVHPLLQTPSNVGIASRDELIAAYHKKIGALTNHFNTQKDLLSPAVPVTIYYLSDNGGDIDDTAPKEIDRFLSDSVNAVSFLSGITPPRILHGNTPAQNWVTSSFEFAQTTRYGLTGVGNVTFLNCAPRLDERGLAGNVSNKGEPIYVGILPNGHVISANSRYNFAFFRDIIEAGELEIFEANVQQDGTQFRSRDIFPTHTAILANLLTQNIAQWKPAMSLEERRTLLESVGYIDTKKQLDIEDIPKLSPFTIAHFDVHGNIKTNTRLSDLSDKQIETLKAAPFKVLINDKSIEARFTERMFDRADGEAGISTGSSGAAWQGAARDDGFLELSVIGGSAAKAIGLNIEDLRTATQLIIPAIQENVSPLIPPAPQTAAPIAGTGDHMAQKHS